MCFVRKSEHEIINTILFDKLNMHTRNTSPTQNELATQSTLTKLRSDYWKGIFHQIEFLYHSRL